MVPFSAIITPQSVSFTTPSGKVFNIDSSHTNWEAIISAIKQLQASLKYEAENPVALGSCPLFNPHGAPEDCHASLAELVDIAATITAAGAGRVTVSGGVVYYEGEEVRSPLTTRILWGLGEGFDMVPYMLFLDNSMENPSKRAVDEMYSFMERNNMGITSDGFILGYKKVKEDFKDIYSGKMDNSPGQIVEMIRNKVDDDARRTCSKGLHFCSMSYLPHYGSGPGDKIVIVKVHPKDIVSVPVDYGHAKVRCCRYEVLSEYTGSDVEDLLGTKAIWSDEDFSEDGDEDDDYWDALNDSDDEDRCETCDAYVSECECVCDFEKADLVEVEDEIEEAIAPAGSSWHAEVLEQASAGAASWNPPAPLTDEVAPVLLSEEGVDMRHIMDTVDAPSTQQGHAMRALLDVVEGKSNEAEGLVATGTEDAVHDAFNRLVAEIEAAQKAKKDE
jgi:hypothetical protein